MKTTTLIRNLFSGLIMMMSATMTISAAETLTSTRIDVTGSRYGDQMWVFAVDGTTRGFDNGWDAYKMIGTSSVLPTIYAAEETGNFQIDVVPDMNNTVIAFKAGEDTVYTFTFSNVLLENKYSRLFLVDSVADKTIEVTPNGSTYTFHVKKTTAPVKRFRLIALPLITSPADTTATNEPTSTGGSTATDSVANTTGSSGSTTTSPQDTTTSPTPATTDTVVVAPTDTTTVTPTPVTPPATNGNGGCADKPKTGNGNDKGDSSKDDKKDNKKDNKNHKSTLSIQPAASTIIVINDGAKTGTLSIYDARTGKLIKVILFPERKKTQITPQLKKGAYMLKAENKEDIVTMSVMM